MARYGPGHPRAEPPDRPAGRPGVTPSILVVDDDPAVLTFVEGVLRQAGTEVTAVGSGRAALRAIADGASKPSLLLTAIELSGMTGIELSARVRALRPGIEVVMMTGDRASAEAARDRPDLVRWVLLKPIAAGELLAATGLATAQVEPS
jgi:two-component system, cell cycle response regulator CpdR